jgi:hypothetical protein
MKLKKMFLTSLLVIPSLVWAASPDSQARLSQAEAAMAKARRDYFNALKIQPGMSAAQQEDLKKRTLDPASNNLNKIVSDIEKEAVESHTTPANKDNPDDQFLFKDPKKVTAGDDEGDDDATDVKPTAPPAAADASDKKEAPKIAEKSKSKGKHEAVVVDGANVPSEITFEKKPKKAR